MCNSEAYQRSSAPQGKSAEEEVPYASMPIKPMTSEQLFDSLATILGTTESPKKGADKVKVKGPAKGSRAAFVEFFRPSEGADPKEHPAGIPQGFGLMNAEGTARTSGFVSN